MKINENEQEKNNNTKILFDIANKFACNLIGELEKRLVQAFGRALYNGEGKFTR